MSRCVCCGAELPFGATKCKYCGTDAPVSLQTAEPQTEFVQNYNQAPPQTQNQQQGQISNSQMADVLQAWLLNNALTADAVRNAAEATRMAAEATRIAAEAIRNGKSCPSGNEDAFSGSEGGEGTRNIFASSDWKEIWKAKGLENRYLGIVLTNTKGLKNPDAFMASLNSYLAYKSQNEIDYYLLDLNNQAIDDIDADDIDDILLNILFPLYLVTVPHYLMIVGDSTVVPMMDWDNVSDVYDDTVPSDLPYLTLDTTSPWDGVEYSFENITQLGRIPAKAKNGFSEAIAYFERAKNFAGYTSTNSFAYSAYVWQRTTVAEFSHLNPNLITSPKYTSNPKDAGSDGLWLLEQLSPDYNMVCFNLHGSDETHIWSGQLGEYFYPDAFEKRLLPQNNGYVLLTEACYGARPTYSDSIVVNALQNGCMAFVGSTRVAYGWDNGQIGCADIIAQQFTYHVAKGETVGESFLKALSELSNREMSEIEIKTLAEFALYGDPSVKLIKPNAHSMQKSKKFGATAKYSKPKKDKSRAILLASCDGSMAKGKNSRIVPFSHYSAKEQSQMKMMANYVSKVGNDYVAKNFASVANVKPNVFKVVGKEEYRAVYAKKVGGIKVIVHMHMDGKGNMKRVYHSK